MAQLLSDDEYRILCMQIGYYQGLMDWLKTQKLPKATREKLNILLEGLPQEKSNNNQEK